MVAHRPSARDLFARELAGALRLLLRAPGVGVAYGPKSGDGVRRLILQRTGYHVYYVHDSEQQVLGILAVWSCRRGRPPSLRLPARRGGSDR